jgi:hypothetical protein
MFQPNGTKYLFASRLRTSINNASLPYNQMKPVNQPENDLNIKGTNKLLLIISNNILGRSLVGSVLSNLSNILESKCKVECLAAATRLILACNAYKITSHELPDALESLVPKYMDSIPLDPYDGKPFRYSKSKAIVYSVGKDLKDSSGSTERPANEKSTSDYDKWKAEDIVFKIEKASD